MTKFKVELLVPEKIFFEGEIDSLTIETSEGQLGILANHAPMAIGLQPSILTMKNDGKTIYASHGEGFVEVRLDKTIILCQTMEFPEEIELNRVNRAIEEWKQKTKDAKSKVEYNIGTATLARAFARLKALKK